MALPDAEIERRPTADLEATAEAFADHYGPGRRELPLLGAADEVVVYDRALAAEEVAALARGAQPPARP
jgi:hypothetical protein